MPSATLPMHCIAVAFAYLGIWILALITPIDASGDPDRSSVRSPEARPATVVMISMDGTRPADVTAENLPSLLELGQRGARADGLVGVDPSNTFPAHVSLATGVRPSKHGLVNNSFIDPVRGRFDRDDAHLWIEADPIWSIAERHGVRSAAYYWVGSEGAWSGGPAPSETRRFSSRTSEKSKVDRILEWLAIEDPRERPRLIVSWFHGADHTAHADGPGASSLRKSLRPQDKAIARLIREMEARGLFESTTLLFVSDHGMAGVETRVNLASKLGGARLGVSVIGVGGFAMIDFDEGKKTPEAVARALSIAREAGLEAWPRREAPSDWHVDHPRFGDIVVRSPPGTAIVTSFTRANGFHGYDARLPAMAGILIARGRGVEPSTSLGIVSSLAIAPTVLRLLNLPVPEAMTTAPIGGLLRGFEVLDAGGAGPESGDTPSR
jgi:predicted AlkP superfamily pyrophosphatase or phosphodiesterase